MLLLPVFDLNLCFELVVVKHWCVHPKIFFFDILLLSHNYCKINLWILYELVICNFTLYLPFTQYLMFPSYRNCLLFWNTWVHSLFSVGFVLFNVFCIVFFLFIWPLYCLCLDLQLLITLLVFSYTNWFIEHKLIYWKQIYVPVFYKVVMGETTSYSGIWTHKNGRHFLQLQKGN